LTPTCAGLLESRGSGLGLLKSTFHAENFICRLSWSISSHFGAIHSWNACCSAKLCKKFTKTCMISSMSLPWKHFYAQLLVSLTAKIWGS